MTARKYVLVLRTCAADGSSKNGFVWPTSGAVECPDWKPTSECGNGLHGALLGEGDGRLFRWASDARWLVVKVLAADVIDLQGKVKFPRGEVVHCGDRLSATSYLAAKAPGRAIIGGTATAGDYGTATAGYGGTAMAGYGGIIEIKWYDGKRCRKTFGYIGEDGLLAGTAYRCDAQGKLMAVSA